MKRGRRKSTATSHRTKEEALPSPTPPPPPRKNSDPPLFRDHWLSEEEYHAQSRIATTNELSKLMQEHPDKLENIIGSRHQYLERQRLLKYFSWAVVCSVLLLGIFLSLSGTHALIRWGLYTDGILSHVILPLSERTVDTWGANLLHALCESSTPSLSTYRILAAHRVPFNQTDIFGRTPLHICIASSPEIAYQMLHDGAPAPPLGSKTILNIFFESLPTEISRTRNSSILLSLLRFILEAHQISIPSLNQPSTTNNYTPLCRCYILGLSNADFFPLCKKLIELGADPNAPHSCKNKPLLHQVLGNNINTNSNNPNATLFLNMILEDETLDVNVLDGMFSPFFYFPFSSSEVWDVVACGYTLILYFFLFSAALSNCFFLY